MGTKLTAYIPLAAYTIAASLVINVIDNEWGWNNYALWATIAAVIAGGGFLMPSRPYSRSR
jgi:hypothetical protein